MLKSSVLVAVLVTSGACGGDDDGGGGGSDAGGGGDGGGGEGPAIESSSPADGDSMVSVLADIEVTFTGDLDPASVTADSVQLWKVNGGETRLFGPVSYDAGSRTVTLTPFDAFDHFSTVEVRLSGLTGDGGAVADAAIRFATTRNLMLRQTSYSDDGLTITGWDGQDYDEWGYDVRYTHYNGPGDNGEWYTDDDDANLRIDTQRDDMHRASRVDVYSGAALDLVQYRVNTFDDRGDMTLEVTYDPADAIVNRRVSTYDAGHRLLRGTSFNGPGDDDVWGNDNDVMSFAEGYVYDADGLAVRRAVYASPGDDGVWGNDNDVPNSWVEYRYTAERRLDRTISHGAAGDDGDWFTDDDEISGYVQHLYDDAGHKVRWVSYNGAGDNGTWFNGDDDIYRYEDDAPFAKSLHAEETYFLSAGDNGVWFTDDDEVNNIYSYDYAASGDLREYVDHRNPGDDGDWGTPDDPVTYRVELTPDLP
jgi:hypothetical protein